MKRKKRFANDKKSFDTNRRQLQRLHPLANRQVQRRIPKAKGALKMKIFEIQIQGEQYLINLERVDAIYMINGNDYGNELQQNAKIIGIQCSSDTIKINFKNADKAQSVYEKIKSLMQSP
jgi:hypothetical protein